MVNMIADLGKMFNWHMFFFRSSAWLLKYSANGNLVVWAGGQQLCFTCVYKYRVYVYIYIYEPNLINISHYVGYRYEPL